jgi:hypothetical protein
MGRHAPPVDARCGHTTASRAALLPETAARVCSVISNWSDRPVFFSITVARSRTLPPAQASSIFTRTRSQLPSLLSMAKENIARSRLRPSGCSRTRMVQKSFGFSGRSWPISRLVFLGPGIASPRGHGVFGGHGRLWRRRPVPPRRRIAVGRLRTPMRKGTIAQETRFQGRLEGLCHAGKCSGP